MNLLKEKALDEAEVYHLSLRELKKKADAWLLESLRNKVDARAVEDAQRLCQTLSDMVGVWDPMPF